jgi:hypothetical protein
MRPALRLLVLASAGIASACTLAGEISRNAACCAAERFDAGSIRGALATFFGDSSWEIRAITSEGCALFVAVGNKGHSNEVAWLEVLADLELDAFSKPKVPVVSDSFIDNRNAPERGYTNLRCCGADRYSDEEFGKQVAHELGLATVENRLRIQREECRLAGVLWPQGPVPAPPDSHKFVEVSPTGEIRFLSAP